MAVKIFDRDDNNYLKWMSQNPSAFVVNTMRRRNSNYFFLHRAKCTSIATTTRLKKGAYTERQFIKVGAVDLNELEKWFKSNNSKFKGEFQICKICKPLGDKILDNALILYPETIEDEAMELFEGLKKQIIVNAYERNIEARQQCLDHYWYSCAACNMNFEDKYGNMGRNFIHVHHLREMHSIGKEYKVDPVNDLIPVCPNCHAMLHQKMPCYSVDELKEILESNSIK